MSEVEDREALEAELMGGEVQKKEPEISAESGETLKEVEGEKPPEVEKESEPEETVEEIKVKLTKAEKERHDFERAMREEREAKRTSERTLRTLIERLETVQAETAKPEEPVYEDDPAAYLKWQNEQILEDRRQETEKRAQEEKIGAQEKELLKLHQAIKQGVNAFAETSPDYNDAAKFLIETRIKQLNILGITDQREQQNQILKEELEYGHWALQKGMSPGELFYKLAQSQGYQQAKNTGETESKVDTTKPRPKSLSDISGGTSGNKESLQARADRILAATNLKDILNLNQEDMEKILKEAR